MIPILYPPTQTDFTTNGLGALSDAIDVTVEEELNGSYELEMEYPVTGIRFSGLTQRAIILAKPDPMTDPQPFRVYRITKPLSGRVRVYARHIAYDQKGITVSPFAATGAALSLQGLHDYAVTTSPFSYTTDKAAGGTFTVSVPSDVWSLLGGQEGSVLDVFGGEYQFDRYAVRLLTRRGEDRGVSIRYGKNLTSFEQDENCAACCTGLYPYWADTDGNLVELAEKIVRATGSFGYEDIRPMDFSGEFEEAPTEAQLRARAERYISDNAIGVPEVSWTVEFAALEQTEEYKGKALLERVLLGDTVKVEFPEMGVSASARAVCVKYKPLLDRYDKITLGRVKSNLARTIVKQSQEIAKKPTMDAIQRATDIATKALIGARGGSLRLLDTDGDGKLDALYIADNEDPAQAQKVWRWNYEGWAASSTGYDGPFSMSATLEAGLLADFVTAAHLTAGTIQSNDGTLFIDLDNGTIRVKALTDLEDKVKKLDESIAEVDGIYFYIRYSQYADGRDMTEAPDSNTQYMGSCSTSTHIAPTDPTAYTWCRVRGVDGTNGTPGADGESSYFHVKYSDDGVSFSPNNGETLGDWIGTCVTETETDPTDFSAYQWKKFTGDDGADGKTYYTWIKYADTPTSGMSDSPEGKKYIGLAYNKLSAAESTSYSVYAWSLIKGEDGSDGVNGINGVDGKTYYTWVKYADDASGTNMTDDPTDKAYIGLAYNKDTPTESSDPSDYAWALFRGSDGIDGKNGADGKTYYTWIKYADTPTSGMSDSPEGKKYIGLAYNKLSAAESTSYSVYAWSLIKGEDGSDGVNGINGVDGKTYYTWVKYADDASGTNMTDDPTDKAYIGLAYNKDTPTESSDPSDYAWALFRGSDGIDGKNGANGVSSYFYVRYSANSNGNPMTTAPTDATMYMGVCSTTSPTAPTSYSSYTWTKCRGNDGTNGTPGAKGADGKTSYLHIKYSDDGTSFTANNGETLGAYIGTLVDFTATDSTTFSDYTWKKFTEDVDDELEDIRFAIQDQYTQITNDTEQIILQALESYVKTGDYDEFKRTTQSQLQLFSEQLNLQFAETTSHIEEINGDLQTKFNTITKFFTFDLDGLTIGASDSPNKLVLDNDEISILVNGIVVQRFDSEGHALIPELTVSRSLTILGYKISQDENSNVNCRYVGG